MFGGNANKSDRPSGGNRDSSMSNRNSSNSMSRRNPQTDNTYQIHVSDFDISITKQQLLELFKKRYHSVVDAKVVMDNSTRISRGYGFVHFTNFEESQKAIAEMNGTTLKGKPIKVNIAVSKNSSSHNSGPGGSSHSRSNSHGPNQSVLSHMYGQGFNSPTNGQRGSLLGGLGVQFKPGEVLTLPPQQYSYINPSTGQPMQAGFAVAPSSQIYAHQLGQQGLIYGYPQQTHAGKPAESLQSGAILTDPNSLHAFGLSQAGLYPPHLGVLSKFQY